MGFPSVFWRGSEHSLPFLCNLRIPAARITLVCIFALHAPIMGAWNREAIFRHSFTSYHRSFAYTEKDTDLAPVLVFVRLIFPPSFRRSLKQ